MQANNFKFNRMELSGSLGDLGTLLPLSVALMAINGLSTSSVLLMIGLFYISTGLYFKLPIPVQPLKVVTAIAIAFPEKITLPVISAAAILFGGILLFLAVSGLIDWLARFFTKPIVRGIQLGLGFILMVKGIKMIIAPAFFLNKPDVLWSVGTVSGNFIIGIIGFFIALILLANKRYPAALVLVTMGMIVGVFSGAFQDTSFALGPGPIGLAVPGKTHFINALVLLVIPQIPLTLGNAVMGTADACFSLFGKNETTKKVTFRSLAISMAISNFIVGLLGAMPMCHGAGGLAAHYRFGARTGGSNLMIGTVFIVLALGFGKVGISLISSIPNAILGILLLLAGVELSLLIKDIEDKKDLFVSILIAGIGFATTNMGIAFFVGILVAQIIDWKKIEI